MGIVHVLCLLVDVVDYVGDQFLVNFRQLITELNLVGQVVQREHVNVGTLHALIEGSVVQEGGVL